MKMTIFIMILAVLTLGTTVSKEHNHFGHSWLGDKQAYAFTKSKVDVLLKNKSRLNLKKSLMGPPDEFIAEIDESFLKAKLQTLSGQVPTVSGESIQERRSDKGRKLGRAFLKAEFEKLGFVVKEQTLTSGFPRREVINLIAEKKGLDSNAKVVVLTAHYDSVGNAGANDNGTGTVGTLAIAKALSGQSLKNTLRVIAFDKEEQGLIGSKAYVKSLSTQEKKNIIGNINFEMMGTNSRGDGVFHIIDCDREDSKHLTEAVYTTVVDNNINLTNNPGCTDRSDHAAFWKANIPAIVISENFFGGDSDKCYHKKCDIVDERLDFTYMKNITYAVYGGVLKLLEN